MDYINLIDTFDREIEVLEINDYSMIYAMDQKNEVMDLCTIGRYDFDEEMSETLMTLDYARLYESFQTYKQNRDYFYCVNVLQDYRLRLRRISKLTWAQEGEVHLSALGEIINFYILNDQYLVIVDEVENSEDYRTEYHIDSEDTYINLVYLYDCFEQKRYPVTDSRLHGAIEQFKLDPETEKICIATTYEAGAVNSAIYAIAVDDFIDAIVNNKPMFLKVIAEGRDDVSVSCAENDEDALMYYMTDAGHEALYRYDLQSSDETLVHAYEYEDHESLVYDHYTMDVYLPEMQEDSCSIICLTDEAKSFVMPQTEETFSGVRRDHLYLTTFYKEVKVKEYEFHENVGIYDLTQGLVASYEGRFVTWKDKIVLLRTFLAL